MRLRVLSAAVLAPTLIGLVWFSYWTVTLAVVVATVIGLHELYGLFVHGGYHPRQVAGHLIALALVLAVTLAPFSPRFDLVPAALTLAIIGSLAVELTRRDRGDMLAGWGLTLGGALYVGWLLSHFVLLRGLGSQPLTTGPLGFLRMPRGAGWIFLVFAITWLQDTLAFFVGRSFGRHKLAPRISPKKTWEGATGGLVGGIAGGALAVLLFGLPISAAAGALIGAIGGIVGPAGDLAESLMKRQVGLKDAGQLIPGHGGILDRADSLLFTAPVVYYLVMLLAP